VLLVLEKHCCQDYQRIAAQVVCCSALLSALLSAFFVPLSQSTFSKYP
jgi:hypothetical protein